MGVKIAGRYLGNKRIELEHLDSGAKIQTSAPKDNQGDGQAFSPTDLLASGLGACMLTIMAIIGEREGLPLAGMRVELEKTMNGAPRRVGVVALRIHMPAALAPADRERLEQSAHSCPVAASLHPGVQIAAEFVYDA